MVAVRFARRSKNSGFNSQFRSPLTHVQQLIIVEIDGEREKDRKKLLQPGLLDFTMWTFVIRPTPPGLFIPAVILDWTSTTSFFLNRAPSNSGTGTDGRTNVALVGRISAILLCECWKNLSSCEESLKSGIAIDGCTTCILEESVESFGIINTRNRQW